MENFQNNKSALIIIDIQNFYWKDETHDELIANMKKLLENSRSKGMHIIYVKHVWGEDPDNLIFDIREEIKPLENETIVIKRTAGSFYHTNLEDILKSKDIENVIITGMKTNHCCDTTTRESSARGYKTFVIKECVRTFDLEGIDGNMIPRETVQYVTLSILQGFAKCILLEDFIR